MAAIALALLLGGCAPGGGGGYGYRPVYVQPSGPYYQPLSRPAPSYAAPAWQAPPCSWCGGSIYAPAPESHIGDGNPWNNVYPDGRYHGYVGPTPPAGIDGAVPPPGGYGGLDSY